MNEPNRRMMHLYSAASPNNRKVEIALNELDLPYASTRVDMARGEQHSESFQSICPNGKIPVLTDGKTTVWESGAILLYLAEHYDPDHRILPREHTARWEAIQLAFFQAAGLGPNLGRLSTQLQRPEAERNSEMVEVFSAEVDRILSVIDRILDDQRLFLAGPYSIADIMHFPWLQPVRALGAPQILARRRVLDWLDRVAARPAIQQLDPQ